MANIFKGNEVTFNQVTEVYDKMRPTYVKALYDDIFAFRAINEESRAVEIGIGTGQATRPILETGCQVTAVELGDKLAAFVAEKYKRFDNFEVKNQDFQLFESEENTFDLVYSASAFHWIPEEIGYKKVYDMLKPGGVFARFANHPSKDKEKEGLHLAFQDLYAVYMPKSKFVPEYSDKEARALADIGKKYGFEEITYKLYTRQRSFSADEYLELLGTYSDHIRLEEAVRKEFFGKIKAAIEDFGGSITMYDTIDLQLYRKPKKI